MIDHRSYYTYNLSVFSYLSQKFKYIIFIYSFAEEMMLQLLNPGIRSHGVTIYMKPLKVLFISIFTLISGIFVKYLH